MLLDLCFSPFFSSFVMLYPPVSVMKIWRCVGIAMSLCLHVQALSRRHLLTTQPLVNELGMVVHRQEPDGHAVSRSR